MKAIHEFDAPDVCANCDLWVTHDDTFHDGCAICTPDFIRADGKNTDRAEKQRYSNCPLITTEGKKCARCGVETVLRLDGLCYKCDEHVENMSRLPVIIERELKPCPFCGGEAIMDYIEAHTHWERLAKIMPDYKGGHFIECTGCTCALSLGNDRNAAIAAWNRRA